MHVEGYGKKHRGGRIRAVSSISAVSIVSKGRIVISEMFLIFTSQLHSFLYNHNAAYINER